MCKENHKLASDVVIAKEYNKDMLLHCAAASARVEKNRPFAVLCCCAVDCAKHFSYVENSFPFHLLFISGLLCLDSVSFRSLERHCSLIWEISISCLGLIMISFPQWSPLCIPPPKTPAHNSIFIRLLYLSQNPVPHKKLELQYDNHPTQETQAIVQVIPGLNKGLAIQVSLKSWCLR